MHDPESPDKLQSRWTFDVEEISASVYRVTAVDPSGRSVTRTGLDPDQLIAECRHDVLEFEQSENKRRVI